MKVPRIARYGLIVLALACGWVAAGYLGGGHDAGHAHPGPAGRPATAPATRPAAR